MNILSCNCTGETFCYISKNSLWLNMLFLDLSNNYSNKSLTIDWTGVKKRGPAEFRTKADNPEKQRCYLNISSNNKQYNTYLTKRLLTLICIKWVPEDSRTMFLTTIFNQKIPESLGSMYSSILMLENI